MCIRDRITLEAPGVITKTLALMDKKEDTSMMPVSYTHLDVYKRQNLDGVFNMVKEVKYRFRSEADPGKGFYGTTKGGGNVTGIERDWMNSRFIADASFFTIKNITLGYTINKSNKFFKSARLYASIQQAYIFTKYWGGCLLYTSRCV